MKFNAEEIKKLILSVIMIGILLFGYKNLMLDDQDRRELLGNKSIADLEPKIKGAQEQILRTAEMEKKAPAENETLEQIRSLIPAGEPVAWFPPHMVEFLKRQGMDKCSVRLNGISPARDLPGFRMTSWAIDLPKTEFVQLAIAIAGLENEEPLLKITNLQIEANRSDLQFQHAVLTVETLVKDEKR